jgi:branched-chain amino acid transport system substrate-binding protein
MGHDRTGGLDRRQFLQRAGASASLLTVPGLLAACGSSDDDAGGSGGGGAGTLKIGYVTPSSGALAPFAEADNYILGGVRKAFADGIKTKKGTAKVDIIVKDSQSSPDRAGAVASDLILKDGVDLIVVSSTPETTNPVSDQCELNGVPCISSVAPWQAWFFPRKGDPKKPFKSTFHFFWGLEDLTSMYTDMWAQVSTNKVVGGLWPNDSDGNSMSDKKQGVPPAIAKAGYKTIDPGRYENGTNDFSAQIARFKAANAQVLTGVPIPPDFPNFYKQASQQGYHPQIASIAKAVLFPSAVEALGELGDGVSTEVWWSPKHPFSSSLTSQSAQQVADAYEQSSGKQWTQPLGFAHAVFEVAAHALGAASDPKDKQAVAEAISKTRMDTLVGSVDWTSGPVPNVAKTPLTGGQWRRESGKYELVIVSNANANATKIPKDGDLKAIGG